MTHENRYRFAAGDAQKRLTELSQGDASDLRDEISLCRWLLENAARQSSPAVVPLLQTLGRLSAVSVQNGIRCGELLDRETLMAFVRRVCAIVGEELQAVDGHEDILDRIAERIAGATKAQPRLEYENVR